MFFYLLIVAVWKTKESKRVRWDGVLFVDSTPAGEERWWFKRRGWWQDVMSDERYLFLSSLGSLRQR